MPELPEVEILVRQLAPRLENMTVRGVRVCKTKVLSGMTAQRLSARLRGASFIRTERRGKYIVFRLSRLQKESVSEICLLGHLGMTGRMYVAPAEAALPKHTAVVIELGPERFVFEDMRVFGRLTFDTSALEKLGPEPMGKDFTAEGFGLALKRFSQPIKVKLLDQSLVAGIGNIYASEALFCARISPALPANKLTPKQVERLHGAIRTVLRRAIEQGAGMRLNLDDPAKAGDKLFYFGKSAEAPIRYSELLWVYERAGLLCLRCGTLIQRMVQAARSTYWCPRCQMQNDE